MSSPAVGQLRDEVQRFFQQAGGAFGLAADSVTARYVLNWGGYGTPSFTVTDGRRAYHLKLAPESEDRQGLRQWWELRALLTARYHAPTAVAWIALPESGVEGLLFVHVEGSHPPPERWSEPLDEVLALLPALHADPDLAARLPAAYGPTYRDCFLDTYVHRLDEDLDIVEPEPPPFVSRELLDWMRRETRRLEALVRAEPAFDGPALAPVHGDLWTNNILVGSDGWHLLDWDGLARGDPAMDYGMLLGPALEGATRRPLEDFPLVPRDAAFRARIELYRRAYLLDWTVDVLADWVDAPRVPEHQEAMRARKQQEHIEYLRRYRERFG